MSKYRSTKVVEALTFEEFTEYAWKHKSELPITPRTCEYKGYKFIFDFEGFHRSSFKNDRPVIYQIPIQEPVFYLLYFKPDDMLVFDADGKISIHKTDEFKKQYEEVKE